MGFGTINARAGLRGTGAFCTLAASVFFMSSAASADILCQQVAKKSGTIKVYYGVTECPNPAPPRPPKLIPLGPALVSIAGGLQGPAGPAGATGPAGPAGAPGAAGPKGDKGDTGSVGPAGLTGPAGAQGLRGVTGATGAQGPQGLPGIQGAQGIQGIKGDKGDRGDTGIQGLTGPAGAAGARGITGATGATGAAGANGANGATGATGPVGPLADTAYGGSPSVTFTVNSGQCVTNHDDLSNLCDDNNGCTIFLRSKRSDGRVSMTRVHLLYGDVVGSQLYLTSLQDSGSERADALAIDTGAAITAIDYNFIDHNVSISGSTVNVNDVIHYKHGHCPSVADDLSKSVDYLLHTLSFYAYPGWTTEVTIHDI